MEAIQEALGKISFLSIPQVGIRDIVDILVVAFLLYKLLVWIKDTRTWALLKGVIIVLVTAIAAYVFRLNTIAWIISNAITVGMIAVLVLFQPELRRALEQIGRGKFLGAMISSDHEEVVEGLSEETINEMIKAVVKMGKVKTGALIVLEQEMGLEDVERTGIKIDAVVSSQLLINIFEKNTPLHDGAVIIAKNRITSATCFLPLSDSLEISKDLGTRHRAAIGVSESSDAMVIVVSEETGNISYIRAGKISRGMDTEKLNEILGVTKKPKRSGRKRVLWKGKQKHE